MPFDFRLPLFFLVSLVMSASAAFAHPHVWVAVQTELILSGRMVEAVRHHWKFDEAFSAFASQGLDENGDGVLSREELQPLAQVNVESLSEYGYFSDLYEEGAPDDGKPIFGDPKDYWLTVEGDHLVLHFTLPVVAKIDAGKQIALDVYDPSFFVDFAFAKEKSAELVNAPQGCSAKVEAAKDLDDSTMALLAQIPADQRELPEELMKMTVTMANQVIVKCN